LQGEALYSSVLSPARSGAVRQVQETPEKTRHLFHTDIGIVFAFDGYHHVVHSVQAIAPHSVLKRVCEGDKLLRVDGRDVAFASQNAVIALLKHSSTSSRCACRMF
jgi:hypothetical protein